MFVLFLCYSLLAFAVLGILSVMILRIGKLLGDCPQSRMAARAAAITIATGFSAIGAGGVVLISMPLALMAEMPLAGFSLALGLATLCLGLGFTHAVTTLRSVLMPQEA